VGDYYPKINIEVTALANLKGEMNVVVLLESLEEATALASRNNHVECSNGLEGHQEGDSKDSELVEHGDAAVFVSLLWCAYE
jgi:hypothetical protein